MKIFYNFTKLFLIYSLILNICSSYCLANIIENGNIAPDNGGGNNISIDKAANGVPVVNINNPNSAGVSHNKFIDFNVGTRGAIMNNSIAEGVSKIGGIVLANPNLRQSANTIINEITGNNASNIAGAIEIFGNRADFILANPNGISVNGGEFINAHKVTLTTGVPIFNSLGELEKLVVNKGEVAINNRDLNLKNLDYFEIVSRTAKLNAKIHAGREVKIITGKNNYNYKTKQPESITNSEEIGLALDSSAIGGLYAGKITIVGTEKGMGVNLGDLSSDSVDDLNITAEGKVTHRNITSHNSGININAKQGIEVVGNSIIHANKHDINYSSNKDIVIEKNAQIKTTKALSIKADERIINNGKIITGNNDAILIEGASIENNGIINAKNSSITLESKIGEIKNEGKIGASSNIVITSKSNLLNKGKIISNQGSITVVSGGNIINCNGEINSKLLLKLKSEGQFNNQNGSVFSKSNIDLKMDKDIINNYSKIISIGTTTIDAKGAIENNGLIESGNVLSLITKKALINRKTINGKYLGILNSSGDIENTGVITFENELDIHADNDLINLRGNITTNKGIIIYSGRDIINDQGGIPRINEELVDEV